MENDRMHFDDDTIFFSGWLAKSDCGTGKISEAGFIWTMLYRVVKMEKWIINIPSHTFGMGTSEDFTIIIH